MGDEKLTQAKESRSPCQRSGKWMGLWDTLVYFGIKNSERFGTMWHPDGWMSDKINLGGDEEHSRNLELIILWGREDTMTTCNSVSIHEVGHTHHFLLCFLLLWTMTWIHAPVFAQWISPIVGYILSCSVWLMDNVVENATVFVWGFFFIWFLQNIVLSPLTKSNSTLCFTQCIILNLSACVPVCAYVHLSVSTHPCTYGSQKLISGV